MISSSGLKLLFLLFGMSIQQVQEKFHQQVHELVPGQRDVVDCLFSSEINTLIPSICCYNGKEKELKYKYLWETVFISLELNNDQFELFQGDSPEAVMETFKSHRLSWSAYLFSFRKCKSVSLNPFKRTCIGISTSESYRVRLIVNENDLSQCLKFVVGLLLFFYARRLSHSQIFHYMCGMTLGIVCSAIISVYLISRILIPNRILMFSLLAGGSTLAYQSFQFLLFNIGKLIDPRQQYAKYLLGYLALSGLISFALCYRFIRPMTNTRTKNLIQWLLQSAGLALIYYSSHLTEVTCILILIFIISRIILI